MLRTHANGLSRMRIGSTGDTTIVELACMTKVLVTGGSGFIGTNLVEHYLHEGHEVINIDTVTPRCKQHAGVWRPASVLDASNLRSLIRTFNPEIVFHLAARTDLQGRTSDDYQANPVGTQNIVASLTEASDLKHVVFASSMLVCRMGYVPSDEFDYCPSTAYGHSKVQVERIVRSTAGTALPWTIVRPTSIWGPWFGTPYRDFFDAVRRGVYFHPKGVRLARSYGYVGNVVYLLSQIAADPGASLTSKTVYLADFEPIEIKAWADLIATEFGLGRVRELPIAALAILARIGDVLGRLGVSAPMTTFRLNNMLTELVVDMSPLEAICSKLPYSTNEGVRLTCDWIRRHE